MRPTDGRAMPEMWESRDGVLHDAVTISWWGPDSILRVPQMQAQIFNQQLNVDLVVYSTFPAIVLDLDQIFFYIQVLV